MLLTPLAFTTMFPVIAPAGTVATIDVAVQLPMVVAVVPLNVTEPPPCVEPKLEPAIVTDVPTAPVVGAKLVMLGAGTTVNDAPIPSTPLACTTTFPVVAPAGTVAVIELALHAPTVAVVPLNFTVLMPCVEPKLEPVIVTDAPTAPVVGARLVMLGAGTTVNDAPILALLLTVTTTLPLVAPAGTVATIWVAVQLVMLVAVVPLNFTELVPWLEPKVQPVIVIDPPTAPVPGDKLVMLGITVKLTPLLALPTVTTTLPVVAAVGTIATIELELQLVIDVAVVPLNFTVLDPWLEPKLEPEIVTDAPTAPEVGDKLVILGAAKDAPDRIMHTSTITPQRHSLCITM